MFVAAMGFDAALRQLGTSGVAADVAALSDLACAEAASTVVQALVARVGTAPPHAVMDLWRLAHELLQRDAPLFAPLLAPRVALALGQSHSRCPAQDRDSIFSIPRLWQEREVFQSTVVEHAMAMVKLGHNRP